METTEMVDMTVKSAIMSQKKSFLFFCLFIRYHNTREVATHKIRNTVTHG